MVAEPMEINPCLETFRVATLRKKGSSRETLKVFDGKLNLSGFNGC
jgi:hypothetical protein